MWNEFAALKELDRERFAKDITLPPAKIRYVMYFTPRSGSSWITDMAEGTRQLSIPGECFNPNFLSTMTRALNANTMEEYTAILERRRNTKDIYGFQITYHQLKKVFDNDDTFITLFPVANWHSFWLIREDIVLQAVSLFKMVKTQIAHTPQTSVSDIAAQDRTLKYDGPEIKRWLEHILAAERGTEALFEREDITPFRMSYERNTAVNSHGVIDTMCRHLGVHRPRLSQPESSHKKIGTSINDQYADRFRAENVDFLRQVDRDRERTLALLEDYNTSEMRA